jgi:hypothetical protein
MKTQTVSARWRRLQFTEARQCASASAFRYRLADNIDHAG